MATAPPEALPVEYRRVEWPEVNRLARLGWRLVPIPAQRQGIRDLFVLERELAPGCHGDHLMEDP